MKHMIIVFNSFAPKTIDAVNFTEMALTSFLNVTVTFAEIGIFMNKSEEAQNAGP